MRRNLFSADSETYMLKMATLKNVQPYEFLMLLKNFNTNIDVTGTTTVARRIVYLRMMLRGDVLREFD